MNASASGRAAAATARRARPGAPGAGLLELPDVAPGIAAQVGAERGRGADPAEHRVHRAVAAGGPCRRCCPPRLPCPRPGTRPSGARLPQGPAAGRTPATSSGSPARSGEGHQRGQAGVRERGSGHRTTRAYSRGYATIARGGCPLVPGMEASATPIIPGQRAPFTLTRRKHPYFTGGSSSPRRCRRRDDPRSHDISTAARLARTNTDAHGVSGLGQGTNVGGVGGGGGTGTCDDRARIFHGQGRG